MSYMQSNRLLLSCIVLAALLLGVVIYSSSTEDASADGVGASGGAMPVETEVVKPQPVQLWKQFSGHVVAVDRADIRPQVDGRIMKILFEDGQHVEKGDMLIVIDPRPYEAALEQAEAALKTARTQANLAEKEYARAQKLIKTSAISQSLLDTRINNRETAAAAIKAAKALVESAKIDLDYAHVKAPISGKISRAEITVGNLVESGASAPLLTSIVGDDKVYVDFEVDENTYLNSVRTTRNSKDATIDVRLKLGGDMEYSGTVHSFDNRIDPTSGTIRARAIFDNDEKILLPGMSVSVQMGSAGKEEHIVVSERAIGTDQDRKFVYVISPEGKASYREVKIGDSIGGKRIVLSGLEEGDTVITEGIVRIRPDMPVTPKAPAEASDNGEKKLANDKAE